jgi:hypothetical protein
MIFFNESLVKLSDSSAFFNSLPFQWRELQGFLTPEAFQKLYENFPPLEKFSFTKISRGYGQRPHNRYHLNYQRPDELVKESPKH